MKSSSAPVWLKPEILILVIFTIAVRLLTMNNLEYHRDELLYFSIGNHPAAGYATVPPLIGWIAWLMIRLFGYSLFAVRIFPALLGGVLIMICASLARELGGSRYASFLSGLGLLASIFFLRTFSIFEPVATDIFLWTLCIYFLTRYINTGKDKYLILFGIFAGISLLNKYLAALLFIGLLLIVPFTRYRLVLTKKAFLAGLLAGFIVFLPNLTWQVVNGFPVFHHMHELYRTQLVHMDIPLFLTDQILMPSVGAILTISGIIFLFRKSMVKFRFLGFVVLFVIISLMLMKGKSYYTLGVYPLLLTAGAVSYDFWLKKRMLRAAFPVIFFLLALPLAPIGFPILNSNGLISYFQVLDKKFGIDAGRRFEDGSIHSLPQDYADMLGWEELTSLTARAWSMVRDKQAAFIYGENYGEAGALTVIGKKYGLPEAISFNESFRYWFPQKFNPDIQSMVYINDRPGDDLRSVFGKVTLIGRISNPDAREYGTGVFLYEEPLMSFNAFWRERLNRSGLAK